MQHQQAKNYNTQFPRDLSGLSFFLFLYQPADMRAFFHKQAFSASTKLLPSGQTHLFLILLLLLFGLFVVVTGADGRVGVLVVFVLIGDI
jgi:hypothetical protein